MFQVAFKESKQDMTGFLKFLKEEGKSKNTIEKYLRDVTLFLGYMEDREITNQEIKAFHDWLFVVGKYKENSVQSYLVSARCYCNQYLGMGLEFPTRVQNPVPQVIKPITQDSYISFSEYQRLVRCAYNENLVRIGMTIQVIASLGLKVSELGNLTKTALEKRYVSVIRKKRECLIGISEELADGLYQYIDENEINSEVILCTAKGNPVDRSNVFRDIKKLCALAGVEPEKLSPERIRGRFAVGFIRSV